MSPPPVPTPPRASEGELSLLLPPLSSPSRSHTTSPSRDVRPRFASSHLRLPAVSATSANDSRRRADAKGTHHHQHQHHKAESQLSLAGKAAVQPNECGWCKVESSSFATAACKTKASRTQPELRAQECARARRTSATTKPAQRRLLRCRAATPDAAAGLSPEGAAHDIRRTRSCVGRHSGRDCNGICRCRGEERRRGCRCAQRCACCGGKRRTCRAQCCRSSKACAASSQTCRSVPRRRSVVIFRRKCGGCFRGTQSSGVCCSHGDGFARNAWGG